jgi:hypothetical protein
MLGNDATQHHTNSFGMAGLLIIKDIFVVLSRLLIPFCALFNYDLVLVERSSYAHFLFVLTPASIRSPKRSPPPLLFFPTCKIHTVDQPKFLLERRPREQGETLLEAYYCLLCLLFSGFSLISSIEYWFNANQMQ